MFLYALIFDSSHITFCVGQEGRLSPSLLSCSSNNNQNKSKSRWLHTGIKMKLSQV